MGLREVVGGDEASQTMWGGGGRDGVFGLIMKLRPSIKNLKWVTTGD